MRGLGIWCLTLLSTLFELYCGVPHFYWWRKPENPEKTTDMPQVTVKLYRTMLFPDSASKLVIGTACTCSCKSTYHTTRARPRRPISSWEIIDKCNDINAGWFILFFLTTIFYFYSKCFLHSNFKSPSNLWSISY